MLHATCSALHPQRPIPSARSSFQSVHQSNPEGLAERKQLVSKPERSNVTRRRFMTGPENLFDRPQEGPSPRRMSIEPTETGRFDEQSYRRALPGAYVDRATVSMSLAVRLADTVADSTSLAGNRRRSPRSELDAGVDVDTILLGGRGPSFDAAVRYDRAPTRIGNAQ